MTRHPLPARLDTPAAAGLTRLLGAAAAAGAALVMDGAAVEQVGQACLQVLASARATAKARGLAFAIEAPSAALVEGCAIAGLGDLAPAREGAAR